MEYFVYHFQLFLLIMMRMSSMMVIAPFYSSGVMPFKMKAIIAFFTTIIIFPVIAGRGYVMPAHMGGYTLLVVQEILIGLYIGFLVAVIFSAFQLAGQFFAVQIGFGINEVLDPLAQVSIPLVGQFKNLLGLDPETDMNLTGELACSPARDENLEKLYKAALLNRPEYRDARIRRDLYRETIKLERAGHFPYLGAFASRQFQGQTDSGFPKGPQRAWSTTAGLRLSLPIFSGDPAKNSRLSTGIPRMNTSVITATRSPMTSKPLAHTIAEPIRSLCFLTGLPPLRLSGPGGSARG